MAKYYGIERSAEYLEHYGIKGMKWGIRKAIQRPISYLRARHRLSKLTSEQKALKKDARNATSQFNKSYKKLQDAKDNDKNSFLIKRLKVSYRRAAYGHARNKLSKAVMTYRNSLTDNQRRRLRNRIIRF